MKAAEIVRTLRYCSDYMGCNPAKCPIDNAGVPGCADELKEKAADLIEALTAERDAAVSDLEMAVANSGADNLDCEFCKYRDRPACEECEWQWRGAQDGGVQDADY